VKESSGKVVRGAETCSWVGVGLIELRPGATSPRPEGAPAACVASMSDNGVGVSVGYGVSVGEGGGVLVGVGLGEGVADGVEGRFCRFSGSVLVTVGETVTVGVRVVLEGMLSRKNDGVPVGVEQA